MAQRQMINDILDVSRIVTGNLHLEMQPLDLATVIEAAIETAHPIIDAKAIRLEQSLDRSTGQVLGDSIRLQQIIGNLLSNSIKFTPRDGKIEVKLERVGGNAQITVSDTGCGISPEFLPYVFDRFRQADSASTRVQSGLGLGLAIVSRLVELHSGTVQALSDGVGKGATFIVSLPVAVETQVGGTKALDLESPDLAEHSEILRGVWVIVVDDEPDARELLCVILRAAGARVTAAGSCGEALALISGGFETSSESRRPDVLVSDIAMPGEDGFDLIRGLRELEPERGGAIPAIALTAYAGDEDRSRVLIEGYQMHLAKPVRLTSLVAAVAKLAAQNAQSTSH
jgi:CheY-like chemotaxis protein/two-component sensor histidine kinase